MLKPTDRLRPDTHEIVAKVIDGEAMIMNVRSGIYYSLDGAGVTIWSAIERGRAVEQVARAVATRYDISLERATEDVVRLAGELLAEQIVAVRNNVNNTPAEGFADEQTPTPNTSAADGGGGSGSKLPAYETPELQIYRDMGDLLALDPPAPSVLDLRWVE